QKKRKMAPTQISLSTYYGSTYLTPEQQKSIEKAMVQAFVCAGIPFRVVKESIVVNLDKLLLPLLQYGKILEMKNDHVMNYLQGFKCTNFKKNYMMQLLYQIVTHLLPGGIL